MKIPPPPPGFVSLEDAAGDAAGFVRPGAAALVTRELARHGTLHAASARWEDPVSLAGRGRLVAARAPSPEGPPPAPTTRWVVRPYLRGGWMAPLLGDRHLALGTPRPWSEVQAAEALIEADMPTARVIAGIVYPGWPWYRGELVTEYLEETRDLGGLLFGDERVRDEGTRRTLLAAAGRIPGALCRAGVLHRDLNAKNLLAASTHAAAHQPAAVRPIELSVIDLDRARIGPVADAEKLGMSTRLARSLGKFGRRRGPSLSPEEWAAYRDPPPADPHRGT